MEESNVWFTSVPTCAYLIIGLDSWWFEPTSLARTYIPCTYTIFMIHLLDIEDIYIYIYVIIYLCILYTVNLHVWVWIVFAVCGTADAAETLWTKHSVALQIKTWILTNGAVHVPYLAYKFVGCCFMVEACHGRWNTWEGEREAKESQEWGDLRIY